MTVMADSVSDNDNMRVSKLTLAVLDDTNWYTKVNYDMHEYL